MKKLLYILIAIVVLLVVIVGGYLLLANHSATSQTQQSTGLFPSSTSTTSTAQSTPKFITLTTTNGSTVIVPDPTQGKTPIPEGSYTYYYLTDNQDTEGANAEFDIEYGTDSSISIILLKEPLSQSRLAAEQSLRTFFPLSNDQLCSLNVSVAVPSSINDVYSGENLGLSFCPGAVQLP